MRNRPDAGGERSGAGGDRPDADRPDPSVAAGGESEAAECPYCGSTDTEREHPMGPSLCRSMHFCHACEQPFEQFG